MDRLYFKIVEASTELAKYANYLAMNANYRDEIDQVTRQMLPQIYEVVNSARDIMLTTLNIQKNIKPTVRENLINRKQS